MQQKIIDRTAFLIPALVFLLFVVYRICLVYYPQPDAGGVEGNVIFFIQRLLNGQHVYTDPERGSFAIAQYTPLYYYLVAGMARLAGITADNLEQVYQVSRIFSLLLNLVFAGMIYSAGRRLFGMPVQKCLAAGALSFIFLEITSFSRPDSLLHVLMIASVYFFLSSAKTTARTARRNYLLLASFIAAIAVFAKQTAIILPVLFTGCMLPGKRWRELPVAVAVYLLTVATGLFFIVASGEGTYFLSNIIGGISNGFRFSWFRSVIFEDFYLSFGLILVPAFFFLLWKTQQDKNGLLRLTGLLIAGLFVLENMLVLKHGSNIGYFTEWWSLLFLLLAYYWPAKGEYQGLSVLMNAVFCFICLVKAFTLAAPLGNMRNDRQFAFARQRLNGEMQLARYIEQKDPSSSGPDVFTNFNTAESFLSNLLFRRAVGPQMDIIGLSSYEDKTYNYSGLLEALRSGQVRWVIMRTQGPQLVFFDHKLDRFKPDTVMAGFSIYKYQPE